MNQCEAVTINSIRFPSLAARAVVAHTLTYVLMGALASHFLNYAAAYANPDFGMRPFASAWVMAGPMLQPVRGLIFATVFYPFRDRLFGRRHGWLLMTGMLIGLGILSTFAPAPGSVEGLIYTTVPLGLQFRGWLEIVPQAVLFSALLTYWTNNPEKRWLTWTLTTAFILLMSLLALNLVMRKH